MSNPTPRVPPAALSVRAGWFSLIAVTLGALMPGLSTTILAVANGDIARDLQVGLGDLQWISTAYLLGLTGSLVLAGKVGDTFGRRRIFLIGIAGFGLSSLLIGLSTPAGMVIALRAVQGVFGGFLTTNALSLLRANFPERRLPTAIGIFNSVQGLSIAAGPILGGLIVQTLGWRWTRRKPRPSRRKTPSSPTDAPRDSPSPSPKAGARPLLSERNLPDMITSPHTPTIVITGATGGLGRIAASVLAERGARLVLTARSAERADETRAEIQSAAPDAEVDVVLADLTRTADVRRAGRQIAERHHQIDVLINNAGVHAFEQRITADGFPEMVAVNYFAPWLLTRELLPTLTRTPGARIVNVGSEASRRHGTLALPRDLTDTAAFSARASSLLYGKSKLLDIMFTLELARRIEGTGVTANVVDPGFNVTGLGRELSFAAPLEKILNRLHIGDPRRGAGLIVKLATDPSFAGQSGGYYTVKGTKRLTPAHPAGDTARQAQLWADTERLLDAQY